MIFFSLSLSREPAKKTGSTFKVKCGSSVCGRPLSAPLCDPTVHPINQDRKLNFLSARK